MKEFVEKLSFTKGKFREHDIFIDVIKLCAYFIQNNILFNQKYEKEYNEILNKYNDDEKIKMQKLIVDLAVLYAKTEEPIDYLGKIFHELNANNKNLGQFFTPVHLQELGAELINFNEEELKNKGYITLIEPSSGSGGMVVAYAKMMKNKGYDYHKHLVVKAKDLDILCSYMTYVQLSLYDIPAVIENGDTLAGDVNFTLYTPQYIYGNWITKESNQKKKDDENDRL